MEKIDTNLYSRQIRAYGIDTMKELTKLSILIVGMRGLGLETAKNLILAGPKEVNIFDPQICSINDLGSNYYINESDVKEGKRRDEASLKELIKLNPYVNLSIMEGDNIFENIKKYNVVIITEMMNENDLIELNEQARLNKIAFIYSCVLGISGFIFSDFGENFTIKDNNGLELKSYIIQNITNDKQGLITIDNSVGWNNKVNLNQNDMVILNGIKGMEELNNNKPKKIILKDEKSFYIEDDTTHYGKYISGGIVKQYKAPIIKNYKSFKERIITPFEEENFIGPIDYTKENINPILHCGFMALQKYFSINGKLPELNDLNEANKITEIAKNLFNEYKSNNGEWIDDINELDESIIIKIARWSKAQISPICSIMGGIVAQESIKYTGKYTPINQWIWFDFFESVSLINDNIERKLNGTRYDDLISIYGNDIQKKLENLNIFLIGAGANGCEFLKNFALMGISCSDGTLVVSDNDVIEISNLNRQFLFRNDNIGDYKSKVACERVKNINNKLKVIDYQLLVGKDTENIFDDKFWTNQDLIIFAVDSIEGRKYIDTQCTNFKLTGIDAGTLGTKGRVQLIIPDKTICYRDRPNKDDEDESIPMCTLHHFPNSIRHCIEWAKVKFLELVNETIIEMKNYINDSKKYFNNKNIDNLELFNPYTNLIYHFINLIKHQKEDNLIEFCIDLYTKLFDHDIQEILYKYPPDYLNKDGSLYWSGSKRIPHPIQYNSENEICVMFVKGLILLFSQLFKIQINENKIKDNIKNVKIKSFIKSQNDEKEKQNNKYRIQFIIENLELNEDVKNVINLITPIEFDKENDLQISIIHSIANLRAENFNIEQCSFLTTKFIAGKIVPSIPTSTASIGGFVSLQILNIIQTNDLSILRNTLFNLAISLVAQLEPEKVRHHLDMEIDPVLNIPVKIIPDGWTIWDNIIIEGSQECKKLIDFIKAKYNVDITLITSESIIIYDSRSKKNKINIENKIEDIFCFKKKQKNIVKNYLWLNITGKIEGITTLFPKFKYIFR